MPRRRGRPVHATLYEDGSVRIDGPRGTTGVGNVGEGGPSRGGYGTIRQFGPSNMPLPDLGSDKKKKRKRRRNLYAELGKRR